MEYHNLTVDQPSFSHVLRTHDLLLANILHPPITSSQRKTMHKTPFFLITAGTIFFGTVSATADALALATNKVAGTIALETDTSGNALKNSAYLRIGAGINFAMDADVNDISGRLTPTQNFSLTDTKIAFETGFVFDIGVGFLVTEALSIEIMTGVTTNRVEKISGTYTQTGVNPISFSGGDGDLYQVPIVANLRYEFDLSENTNLGLYAGGGFQYADLKVSDTILGSASNDVWSFRYQAGFDLTWDIAPTATLGFNFRYSSTNENDFGTYQGVDIKVDRFQNIAFGATFTVSF